VSSYGKLSWIFQFKEEGKTTKKGTTQQTITTLQFNQVHITWSLKSVYQINM
jgi:hypothetical protein